METRQSLEANAASRRNLMEKMTETERLELSAAPRLSGAVLPYKISYPRPRQLKIPLLPLLFIQLAAKHLPPSSKIIRQANLTVARH